MWKKLLTISLLAATAPRFGVHSLPNGAAQCLVGQPSVGGSHLPDTQGGDGTLTSIGIELAIDGTVLSSDPSVTHAIATGVDHVLVVKATGTPFRGFLVAASAPPGSVLDLSSTVVPDDAGAQPARACVDPVFGITHVDNHDKSSAAGVLHVDEPGEIFLDVTVVMQNSDGISWSGWDQFRVTSVATDTHSPTSLALTGAPTIALPVPSPGPTAETSSLPTLSTASAAPLALPSATLSPVPVLSSPTSTLEPTTVGEGCQ